jgi:bifunctional UDP-N-acetylglucosamine pyrophosphorylase/glucosamine-1-phosphate N-acetyltransferase
MKTLFLCGGIGNRMFPIAEDKFLLKFLGKTLLEHQIEAARGAGLREFIFVCNPQNVAKTEKIAKNLSAIHCEFAVQKKALGIADALGSASHLLNSELLVVNPNDVFDGSLYGTLLAERKRSRETAYITGYQVQSYFPGGYLTVNEHGRLTGIIEKPGPGHEPSDMVNLLVHLHTDPTRLLSYVAAVKTERDDAYERALDRMCVDNQPVRVVSYRGNWTPIKYPWNILDAAKHFLDGAQSYMAPTASVSDRAVIDGKVVIEDGARIFENAVIRGPAYIGHRTVIGNSSLVRHYSHIGDDCVVGFGTEVKGSYVGDGCGFHMNYIGDSVLGEGCNFGAGTITANWRFDEKKISVQVKDMAVDTGMNKLGAMVGDNCKTGINVSIMPGVRIGSGALIGPSVCLARDVAADGVVLASTSPRRERAGQLS